MMAGTGQDGAGRTNKMAGELVPGVAKVHPKGRGFRVRCAGRSQRTSVKAGVGFELGI